MGNSRPTVVLDNGASHIKVGLTERTDGPRTVLNAVVRSKGDNETYFGHEMERCRDYASLHYRLPFDKGYLIDWDAQKGVWDGIYSKDVLDIDTSSSRLLITEPYFNLPNIQDVYDQFVFEEYQFDSYYRCTPADLVAHSDLFKVEGLPHPECMVVIDSGFSFTHIVPIMSGSIIWSAVKRLDVGGKLLTNHLKELISFRQWNMMDETYIMNEVKETCCYVTDNYRQDLELCRSDLKNSSIVQEYVLPDLGQNRAGHIREKGSALDPQNPMEQVLLMGNERFAVPEVIFRPDDIGLDQAGLAQAVVQSIALLPQDLQGMFWANIGLVGGNIRLLGFKDRLYAELRSLAPAEYDVIIYDCPNPDLVAYHGGVALASAPAFDQLVITRAEYQESGSNACRRKFRDWKWRPEDVETPVVRTVKRGRASTARNEPDASASPEEDEAPTRRSSWRGRRRGSMRGRRGG